MAEQGDWVAADWPEKLQQASVNLTAALKHHAVQMASWSEGDLAELHSINAPLRSAFQEYEDLLGERTGSLLDLGRVDTQNDTFEGLEAWPEAHWVTVIARHDYRLSDGERLEQFHPAGRNFTAGIQVTLVPERPLPVDDPTEWPPERFQDWIKAEGTIIHEDIFDPLV